MLKPEDAADFRAASLEALTGSRTVTPARSTGAGAAAALGLVVELAFLGSAAARGATDLSYDSLRRYYRR